MHPEMVRALARARHDDLLNTYPTRGQPALRSRRRRSMVSSSRRRLGSLLIRAGGRLLGDGGVALEIAHE
jgi:hypothetical protein